MEENIMYNIVGTSKTVYCTSYVDNIPILYNSKAIHQEQYRLVSIHAPGILHLL